MSKVILISPPYMKLSHPSYEMPLALTKGCDYMNPGLLICSAILDLKNVSNKIIKINNPLDSESITSNIDDDTMMAGISCTCAWEYLESLKIAETIKQFNPNIKTIISGWQVKSIREKVFQDSAAIDYIVLGDAEYTIYELYQKIIEKNEEAIPTVMDSSVGTIANIKILPKVNFQVLDFTKFPDYIHYLPYVEESRNCPFSCSFCLNSCVNDRYQNVPFDTFVANVKSLELAYGEKANASLLAANFGVNYKETKRKLEYLKFKKIKWNIELHVDNPWEYYINDLKDAGIEKVSIGFESGSPRMLKLMNKSLHPDRYLKRLEEMLIKLNEQKIKPSLNLLIDYRDDYNSLSETLLFLDRNKSKIKKVKANFMFAFDGLLNTIDYSYEPNIIIDDYGKRIHAYPILPKNVSLKKISYIIDEVESGNYSQEILNILSSSENGLSDKSDDESVLL